MTSSIGIGVPVFNGEDYLGACLSSIAEQDHDRIDVVISDNASTDGTEEISREFCSNDPRFRYVRQPENLGAAGNYNYVMLHSRGDYYKMAAHDDVLGPGFLGGCAAVLDTEPGTVLAFPRTRYIGVAGEPLGAYEDPLVWRHDPTAHGRLRDLFVEEQRSHARLCYPIMGVMRRDAALGTRGIQAFRAADAAMLVELALQGDFVEIDEPLYLKRLHPTTSMRANSTPEEFAQWYDPRASQREPMPLTRLVGSNLSAPWRAPLPVGERLACTAEALRWTLRERRFRIAGSELRHAARRRLAR